MHHGVHIPDDLLIQILILVPVKSLLQFKSVCKSWHSIIESPTFVAPHYHRQKSHGKPCLLFGNHPTNSVTLVFVRDAEFSHHSNVKCPVPVRSTLQFIGSSNGLVSFSIGPSDADLCIWNPATNHLLRLPTPNRYTLPIIVNQCLAFGFHPRMNDYRLMIFISSDENSVVSTEAEVYSSREKSWRELGVVVCEAKLSYISKPIVVDGVLYWCREKNGLRTIWCFHMEETERRLIREIEFPEYDEMDFHGCKPLLFPLSTSTAMAESSLAFGLVNGVTFYVWLADFSKPEEIWMQSYKFELGNSRIKRPLGFWRTNNGEAVFVSELGNLIFWNLEAGKWKDVDWEVCYPANHVVFLGPYIENLVPVLNKI